MNRRTTSRTNLTLYIFEDENRAFIAMARNLAQAKELIEDQVLKYYQSESSRETVRRILARGDAVYEVTNYFATEFNWG